MDEYKALVRREERRSTIVSWYVSLCRINFKAQERRSQQIIGKDCSLKTSITIIHCGFKSYTHRGRENSFHKDSPSSRYRTG